MAETGADGFRPIPNPYIVGNPIEDRRMFFGREDDFRYIGQKVSGAEQGGMIVLCGARRCGKTSILFQIARGRLGPEFVPVLIDMQSMTVEDDGEFLARLASEIVETVGDAGLGGAADIRPDGDANPYARFRNLIDRIAGALHGRKLVLMFDEYELFETHIQHGRLTTDILNLLASWMEARSGIFIVFTGSDRIEERSPQFWQAFMGKALHRRISYLSSADTLRLIVDPVRGAVEYADDLPSRILWLTAGQPFYTQVICQSLVDRLNEERRRVAGAEDLRHVVDEIIANPLPQMIFNWSSLSPLEKVALSVTAELGRERSVPVRPADVAAYLKTAGTRLRAEVDKLSEAFERLFHRDLLLKERDREEYTFKMDLWRQWTARMHSIWQVVDELTSGGEPPGPGLSVVRRGGRSLVWWAAAAVAIVVAASLLSTRRRAEPPDASGPAVANVVTDSAHLTVTTDPRGAAVFVDGRLLGTTPLVDRPVAAGRESLRVALPGYETVRLLQTFGAGDTVVVTRRLHERTGSLEVTSQPSGARVSLVGDPREFRTPCRIDGLGVNRSYEAVLELPHHVKKLYTGLEVPADSVLAIDHVFALATYPLTVITSPGGAHLVVGSGPELGVTPYQLTDVPYGEITLRLSKPGYETAERRIAVPAPRNLVAIELEHSPPGLVVFRIVPYAEIWIDGIRRAEVAVADSFELDPGTHRCELRNAYYGVCDTTLALAPSERREIRYDFTKRGAPR